MQKRLVESGWMGEVGRGGGCANEVFCLTLGVEGGSVISPFCGDSQSCTNVSAEQLAHRVEVVCGSTTGAGELSRTSVFDMRRSHATVEAGQTRSE